MNDSCAVINCGERMPNLLDSTVARQPLSRMAVSWYALLALAVTTLGATISPSEKHLPKTSTCGRVWLTVHSPEIRVSLTSRILDALELNWDFRECSTIKSSQIQIGLFSGKPTSWNNAMSVLVTDYPEGHFITNISLGEVSLPGGWENGAGVKGPQCLWPWVGAGDSNQILFENCLKIQPTWMEDSWSVLNPIPVGLLAIAGTHNAGAWRFDTEISTLARDNFVLCQDRSIWAQLVHGIRYFDFRIAYYDFYDNEDDRYWLNHNLIRVRPLVPLLREVKKFLDLTKEVVFLDAHHFPVGFYDTNGAVIRSVHEGLLRIIQREFGSHLAFANIFGTDFASRGPRLKTLVDADKRLLFSYVDNSIVNENNWLWPVLPHLWANTNSPTELLQFLDREISNSPRPTARSPLFSAMAQTTPTVLDILFLRGSLRENADDVNRNVTARLSTVWRSQANIVSTDFFLGSDVVDVSIEISKARAANL